MLSERSVTFFSCSNSEVSGGAPGIVVGEISRVVLDGCDSNIGRLTRGTLGSSGESLHYRPPAARAALVRVPRDAVPRPLNVAGRANNFSRARSRGAGCDRGIRGGRVGTGGGCRGWAWAWDK